MRDKPKIGSMLAYGNIHTHTHTHTHSRKLSNTYEFCLSSIRTVRAFARRTFATVRRARARTVRIEERQDSQVWESLRQCNVSPRLYHFVLWALWRKVPVAARMFAFGFVSTPDCTLCP